MSRFSSLAFRLPLAVLAGAAWSLVYPHDDVMRTVLLLGTIAGFALLLLVTRAAMRSRATALAVVSAASGIATGVWVAGSWRLGWWYPDLPHVLHRIFATDGESSYNASEGQLFLLVFVSLLWVARCNSKFRSCLSLRPRTFETTGKSSRLLP